MSITRIALTTALSLAVAACATDAAKPTTSAPSVQVIDRGANAVWLWDERATATINLPPSPAGTPEERRPISYATVDEFVREVHDARIVGGMRFRHSTAAGEKIGV